MHFLSVTSQILQEADFEKEIFMQEMHWGILNTHKKVKKSRTSQKEKLNCDVVTRKSSANPIRSSGAGLAWGKRTSIKPLHQPVLRCSHHCKELWSNLEQSTSF